jgi:sugar transferase (PEP-CTERM/EpsH1 system associated)
MRILFVAARFPYPALLGYQVRALHQLRLLSRRHRITLLSFGVGPLRAGDLRVVAEWCEEVVTVPLRRAGMLGGVLRGLASDRPLQTLLFETSDMHAALRSLLAERRHDVVHLQLARMAGHLDHDAPVPRVIDLIDALSLNMRRRRAHDHGPMRWAAGLESGRLARYERAICRTWERALVVSHTDRDAIGDFPNLLVNSNGVDLARFRPRAAGWNPHRLVFTGNLGYFPNVDALRWFVDTVLPILVRSLPEIAFAIVGARPNRAVRRLARRDPRITLEGRVDDLHGALARSAVAVAPMRAGSGQKLKVLEAMASGVPVVATTRALSGIDADPERHLLVGDSPEAFAHAIARVMRDPALAASLSTAGRQLVEQRYTWERTVGELEALYHSLVDPEHEHEVLQHAS